MPPVELSPPLEVDQPPQASAPPVDTRVYYIPSSFAPTSNDHSTDPPTGLGGTGIAHVIVENGSDSGNLLGQPFGTSQVPPDTYVTSGPQHGTLAIDVDGDYLYTPDPNFTGFDTFSVQVGGPGLQNARSYAEFVSPSGPGLLVDKSINKTLPNDSTSATIYPWADAGLAGMAYSDSAHSITSDIVFLAPVNDSLSVVSGPGAGTQIDPGSGPFDYQPPPGFTGTVSLTYTYTYELFYQFNAQVNGGDRW